MQHAIPAVMMRGGTSRGLYFLAADLPARPEARDKVLLAAMGSPDRRQIDGLGGGTDLTSKVAIISRSTRRGMHVDYLFAQVSVTEALVDTTPNCGNILSGVGPFAIENGLVPAEDGETHVRIFNVNTGKAMEAVVHTPNRRVQYEGDFAIAGVPGTGAPIFLKFLDIVGSKTGKLWPTGSIRDTIEGVEVTCIDVAVPMVMIRAQSLGLTGYEAPAEIDADPGLLQRIETIRRIAGQRMGLGDVSKRVSPKVGLIAPPRDPRGSITSRYLTPHRCHAAHAVTGALCVGTLAMARGSVSDGIARVGDKPKQTIVIEHPTGQLDVTLVTRGVGPDFTVRRGGTVRTARRLFQGTVFVAPGTWDGSLA
jgi:2-methylaconitate cis-trans-isomerase PrpF